MKKTFGFRSKKGSSPFGSSISPRRDGSHRINFQPGYRIRDKDLGKIHKAASVGNVAKVQQVLFLGKSGLNDKDKMNRSKKGSSPFGSSISPRRDGSHRINFQPGYRIRDKDLGKIHKAASVGNVAKVQQVLFLGKSGLNDKDKMNRSKKGSSPFGSSISPRRDGSHRINFQPGYRIRDKDLGKIHKAASVGNVAKVQQVLFLGKSGLNDKDKMNRSKKGSSPFGSSISPRRDGSHRINFQPGYRIRDKDLGKIHKAASVGNVAKVQQVLFLGKSGLNDKDKMNRSKKGSSPFGSSISPRRDGSHRINFQPGYRIRDKDLGKIHKAASVGNVAKVQQVLFLGKSGLNDKDKMNRSKKGSSPFGSSISPRRDGSHRINFQPGYRIRDKDLGKIHKAASVGNVAKVQQVLFLGKSGLNDKDKMNRSKKGSSPFGSSISPRRDGSHRINFQPGYRIRDKDLGKIHKAASVGNVAKVQQVLFLGKSGLNDKDKMNRTALHLACANGHLAVVALLLERRCRLNLRDSENRTALMKAVECQEEGCATLLLEYGADPNLMDANGNTALHHAVFCQNISLAAKLLSYDANIEARNEDDLTPLLLAISERKQQMVEFLVKKEANVHAVDKMKRTALILAVSYESMSVVSLLLQRGADVFSQDVFGRTAEEYAALSGFNIICQLISEYKAKRPKTPPEKSNPVDTSSEEDSLSRFPSEPGVDLGPPSNNEALDFKTKHVVKPKLTKLMKPSQQSNRNIEAKCGILRPERTTFSEDSNSDSHIEDVVETFPKPSPWFEGICQPAFPSPEPVPKLLKSVAGLGPTKVSDSGRKAKGLLRKSHMQDEIAMPSLETDTVKNQNQEKEKKCFEDTEIVKGENDYPQKAIKLNKETLTETVFQHTGQLNVPVAENRMLNPELENAKRSKERLETEVESYHSRLAAAIHNHDQGQISQRHLSLASQKAKDKRLRLQDPMKFRMAKLESDNEMLSQQLSKVENKFNKLKIKLHQTRDDLREKTLMLERVQRDLGQAECQKQDIGHMYQNEQGKVKEYLGKQESLEERLSQLQSENMLLRQQLDNAQNRADSKEKTVISIQDQFQQIVKNLHAEHEKQGLMLEERSKDLSNKLNHLEERMCQYENEKAERQAVVRQLRQELADSLKKQSASELSLEVMSRYHAKLEVELRDLKNLYQLTSQSQETQDQHTEAGRYAEKTQDHIQKLEIENAKSQTTVKKQAGVIEQLQKNLLSIRLIDDRPAELETVCSQCLHMNAKIQVLREELLFMTGMQKKCEELEKNNKKLEQKIVNLKSHIEMNMTEHSQVEQHKQEIEERVRQELVEKFKEVNTVLQIQAAFQENLEQTQEKHIAFLRSQMELRIKQLESELLKMETYEADLEKYKKLYLEELKVRKSLEKKLDKTNWRLAEMSTELEVEKQRKRSLLSTLTTRPVLEPPSQKKFP